VIIDSLNGYSKAMQDAKILDLQLHEMLSYLGQLEVVTIMGLAGFLNEFHSPAAPLFASRNADDPAALDLCDLADHRPDGTRGRSDDIRAGVFQYSTGPCRR